MNLSSSPNQPGNALSSDALRRILISRALDGLLVRHRDAAFATLTRTAFRLSDLYAATLTFFLSGERAYFSLALALMISLRPARYSRICGRLFLLQAALRSALHSMQSFVSVRRSEKCPRLHAAPVLYVGKPSAKASCLLLSIFLPTLKAPVVHKPRRTHALFQDAFLFSRWVNPNLAGSMHNHC